MNALLKKEIRLLLPSWIAAMFLAAAPVLLMLTLNKADAKLIMGSDTAAMWTEFFLLLGIIFLGIASFGQEFSYKTFSLLLSQPVSRKRIWFVKTSLLAFAFLSVLLAAMAAWSIYFYARAEDANWGYSTFLFSNLKVVWFGVFVFLSGGLLWALLLRQISGAFWFTLLIPGAIAASVGQVVGYFDWSEKTSAYLLGFPMLFYSVGGFFFARKLFFNAQDVQWTGGNVLFPWRKKTCEQSRSFVPAFARNRFLALIWKEIQLHEASLFIAAILFVLHLATIPGRVYISNGNFKMAFESYWTLWLLMPLVIGASAVAEERKGGTLEFQLCLPVRRSTQFSIKFFVALILSVLFGAVMPSVIEHTKTFGLNLINFWIFLDAIGVFFVSFYASTLARSLLQAMGMAIGIPLALWVGLAGLTSWWTNRFTDYENSYWVPLALIIGVPSLLLVLARLMFWNFKWLHQDWKMWRRNAAVVLGFFVTVIILSCGIYYRAWELLGPKDYPHGAARITNSKEIKFSDQGWTICTILPNGRLWMGSPSYHVSFWMRRLETYSFTPCHAQFAIGTNWISVASGWPNILALKSDGSLWRSEQKVILRKGYEYPSQSNFEQIGTETNWSQIAGRGSVDGVLLLKNDGSLWVWGTNYVRFRENSYERDFSAPPVRIGDQNNWSELLTINNTACAKNKKGELWAWKFVWNATIQGCHLVAVNNQEGFWQIRDQRAISITNGELWFSIGGAGLETGEYHAAKKLQLGAGMKWKAAQFGWLESSILALRDDGTLWKFSGLNKFYAAALINFDATGKDIQMTQFGTHSDWIELPANGSGLALAADGSLWLCERSPFSIIGPSRRPVFVGNIFEASN